MAFNDEIAFYQDYYSIHHFVDGITMAPCFSFRGIEDKEIFFQFNLSIDSIENYNRGQKVEKIESMFRQLNALVRDKKLEKVLKDEKF